jgi:hypothetical protein
MDGVPGNRAIDVVVLRKRARKTLGGLCLRAAAPQPGAGMPVPPGAQPAEAERPKGPVEFVRFGPKCGKERDFHASSQHDGLTIEVSGRVGGGAVTVRSIAIHDGAKEVKVKSLEDVPADYKEQVQGVIDRATRGRVGP